MNKLFNLYSKANLRLMNLIKLMLKIKSSFIPNNLNEYDFIT